MVPQQRLDTAARLSGVARLSLLICAWCVLSLPRTNVWSFAQIFKEKRIEESYGPAWDVGPDGHWLPPPTEGGPTKRLAEVPVSYEAFYDSAEDAMRAEDELDGMSLRGSMVQVTWPSEKFARKDAGMVNVQGVPSAVPEEEVREFLEQVGKIQDLRRYKDIRFGEVLFKKEDDAWDELKDHFRPMGEVSFCTIHGASRTARVSFLDAKHAASAVKDLSRSYIDGYNREIKVTYPYHRCQTEVRVSCLDKEVTEEELRKHFEKAGSVDEVEFITEEVPPEFKEHIIL